MLKPAENEVRKPTKTISGITPVAVMLPPRKCNHGLCTYCPNLDVTQSYTPKSPVFMRASEVDFDSFKQVQARINAFLAMHHPVEKIELIIMGGTFLQYPVRFQTSFVKGCYDALNGKISKDLIEAQKINEKTNHRCVALCIETRPDECTKHIQKMREFGVTRVELGVQMPDDKIYNKVNRGHSVKEVIDATRELKNAGFKVGYHIMPGLPSSNPQKDLTLFKKIFSDENFKPDQLKIYPCQVIKNSKLEQDYWKKRYKPYTKEQIKSLLIKMMKMVPEYCRVMRIMREIPPEYLVAGTIRIDLRKEVEEGLRKEKSKIKEIRFREVGFNPLEKQSELKLNIMKYVASKGEEYFLEIVNKENILFGLLRLRINGKKALVRELHVYGQSLNLHEESKYAIQHQGLGKWLMEEAENIAKKEKSDEILVISGVGVREYYRKLGYILRNTYMVKKL